jgi:hypothetical protein
MRAHKGRTWRCAILAGAGLATALAATPARADVGDVRRCDSDPSAHTCRMGARFFGEGDFFWSGGLFWQVQRLNGGTFRVQVKPPDGSDGYWTP